MDAQKIITSQAALTSQQAEASGEKFSLGDFFRELGISSAIQTVLGLVAVAARNPNSKTFRNLRGPLRQLRDGLAMLPLDE